MFIKHILNLVHIISIFLSEIKFFIILNLKVKNLEKGYIFYKVILNLLFYGHFLYSSNVSISYQHKFQFHGKNYNEQIISLSNSLNKYDIRITSEVQDGKLVNTEVGIDNPNHSFFWKGFMRVLVNGKYIEGYPLVDLKILKQNNIGGVEFIYEAPNGKARCRFLLYPDDEMLYIEWAFDEGVNGNKVVELICLPAILNIIPGQDKIEVERAVKTKSFLIKQGSSQLVNIMNENWAVFMDLIWDISDENKRITPLRGGITGPAGVVFQPLNRVKLKYNVAYTTDPFIRVISEYPKEINIIKFAICEFRTIGNQMAIKKMETRADEIVKKLEKMTTISSKLTDLNFEIEKKKIESMVNKLKEKNFKYKNEIFKLLEDFILAREKWEEEKERMPVSSEIYLHKFYDKYLLELERLERLLKDEGNILIIKGLYSSFFKIDSVKNKYPLLMSNIKYSYLRRDYNYGFYVDYFPVAIDEIMKYDVIILIDIDVEAIRKDGIELLCSYLEKGGGLVILGGYYSYGLSSIYETKLGNLIPVESKSFDLYPMRNDNYEEDLLGRLSGAPLKPVHISDFFIKDLAWEKKPVTLWQHKVYPKPGAEIHIYVDSSPFLVTGSYGNGRIALITGTVFGTPMPDVLPFWEWESWPDLLGRIIAWAGNKSLK